MSYAQLTHTSGYFRMYPYNSTYDDGSYAKIYYNGNTKEIIFNNFATDTPYTSLRVGNVIANGQIKGEMSHTSGYLSIKPFDSSYDEGSETRVYYDGNKKELVFTNSEANTYYSGITVGHIFSSGPVKIGTSSAGSHKLAVNGSIRSKEINVEANGWADFVFDEEYKLMPLSELETFIQKYGHLPNVPTEAEVMENGVNLKEMNVKLLEKVEELTLYVITLQKNSEAMKSRIEFLENKD